MKPLQRRHYFLVLISFLLGLVLVLAAPSLALQAQILPSSPQLGDTLSVTLPAADMASGKPMVRMGKQTYAMFPSVSGWRALIPTTPLDMPGMKSIQVMGEGQVQTLAVKLRDRSFPVQRIWLPPGKDDLGSDFEFDRVDAFKKLVTPEKYWQGVFFATEFWANYQWLWGTSLL
ncbi:hypothetical protein [Neosynechococcus sphagnicola]|uniref:hypothetical protein n=1 Tax=Neosynechococcus sphagnicola TaxID=1501145 RepID=UPI0009079C27